MALISPIFRFHMNIFRAGGFCTIWIDRNLETSHKLNRLLILWSIVLMLAFNVAAFTSVIGDNDILFKDDNFGYFNDILKVIFSEIAVTTSYFGSIWNRCHLYEFWKIYNSIQSKETANAKTEWRKDLWQNRYFLVIFYIAFIVSEAVAVTIFICYQQMTRHLILFWSVFMPFFYAAHLRNMQFVFYIEVIRQELVKLKQDLHLLVDYSRFHAYGTGFKGFEEFLRTKIAEKQKTYQKIFEMFEMFQKSFGVSIAAVLLLIYVRVLVDSYFAYYTIFAGVGKAEIFLLFPACMQIPIFLIISKNCMDVVKYITLNLHSIISQFNNQSTIVTVQLQNFSLQILHQHICINGIGICRMDGYMLARVIGSITTYMIFFIQFMPKFANI